jgi:hypothetical protein
MVRCKKLSTELREAKSSCFAVVRTHFSVNLKKLRLAENTVWNVAYRKPRCLISLASREERIGAPLCAAGLDSPLGSHDLSWTLFWTQRNAALTYCPGDPLEEPGEREPWQQRPGETENRGIQQPAGDTFMRLTTIRLMATAAVLSFAALSPLLQPKKNLLTLEPKRAWPHATVAI